MRFLADAMLGKLARWLRLLGYDTVYDPACNDVELLRRARDEGRILLTRDTRLARRRLAQNCLLITSDRWREQLKQVVATFSLSLRDLPEWARCVECNGALAPVERATIRFLVPAHICETHREFKRCSACRKVYWRGTHWEAMETILSEIFGERMTISEISNHGKDAEKQDG